MNIHGYYEPDDIWVPDPHEKEFTYHKIINEFHQKQQPAGPTPNSGDKVEDGNTSFMSDIESNSVFKMSQALGGFQPLKQSNDRRGFGNTLVDQAYRGTVDLDIDTPLNTTLGGAETGLNKENKLIESNNNKVNFSVFHNPHDMSILSEQPSQLLTRQQTRTFSQNMENQLQIFQNNGGVEDMVRSYNYQEVINVSKRTKDDKIEFDVTVSLYTATQDRFIFYITKKQNFQLFFSQIKDVFEMKYDYFKGLTGLRVKNIRVKQPNILLGLDRPQELFGSVKGGVNESMMSHAINPPKLKEESLTFDNMRKIEIENQDELVSNVLRPRKGDRLYIEMESQELWLRVKMQMKNSDVCFISDFDIKLDCNMTGKDLKKVIQKLSISIWNDLIMLEGNNKNQASSNNQQPQDDEQQIDDLIQQPYESQQMAEKVHKNAIEQLHILTNIQIFKVILMDDPENSTAAGTKDKRMQRKRSMRNPNLMVNPQGVPDALKQGKQSSGPENNVKYYPIHDDTTVIQLFTFQQNKMAVKCDFMSVLKYYQYFIEEIYRHINFQRNNIPQSFPDMVNIISQRDVEKEKQLEAEYEFFMNLQSIDPQNLKVLKNESKTNTKQLKQMFRQIIESENQRRMNNAQTDKQIGRLATFSHQNAFGNDQAEKVPQSLKEENSLALNLEHGADTKQLIKHEPIQQSRTLSINNKILNNSNNRMQTFGIPVERSIDEDSNEQDDLNDNDDDIVVEKTSLQSNKDELDSTIITHNKASHSGFVEDDNLLQTPDGTDLTTQSINKFSQWQSKVLQDQIRKRFLYSNQAQEKVLLTSQKHSINAQTLISKHRLISQTIKFVQRKSQSMGSQEANQLSLRGSEGKSKASQQRFPENTRQQLLFNSSNEKMDMKEIIMEIEIDEQEIKKMPREVEEDYLTMNQGVKRTAKSFMGRRATQNIQGQLQSNQVGRKSDEKSKNLNSIQERLRDSEVSGNTQNNESELFNNHFSRQTTRKSDTYLPKFAGGTNAEVSSIPYLNQSSTPTNAAKTNNNNSIRRNKSTTYTANDQSKYMTQNTVNGNGQNKIEDEDISQNATEMNMGKSNTLSKKLNKKDFGDISDNTVMEQPGRTNSKTSNNINLFRHGTMSSNKSGFPNFQTDGNKGGAISLFGGDRMNSEVSAVMEQVQQNDARNVFAISSSQLDDDKIKTVNLENDNYLGLDKQYKPSEGNPSLQLLDKSGSNASNQDNIEDEEQKTQGGVGDHEISQLIKQANGQSINIDNNNNLVSFKSDFNSVVVNTEFKQSAAMPLIQENSMVRNSEGYQQQLLENNLGIHSNKDGQKSGKLSRFVNIFKRKQTNMMEQEANNTANFSNNTQSLLVNNYHNTSNSVVFNRNFGKMNRSAFNQNDFKSNQTTSMNNIHASATNLAPNSNDYENSSARQPSQLHSQILRDPTLASNQSSTTLSNFKNRFFNKEAQKNPPNDSVSQNKQLGLMSMTMHNTIANNTHEKDQDGDEVSMSLGSREVLNYSAHHMNTYGNGTQYKKDLDEFEARLIELLPLPSFLLTVEEYNQIPEPQLKNFNHREVSKIKGVSSMDRIKYKSAQARIYNKKFAEYCCSNQTLAIWIVSIILLFALIYLSTFYIIVGV